MFKTGNSINLFIIIKLIELFSRSLGTVCFDFDM